MMLLFAIFNLAFSLAHAADKPALKACSLFHYVQELSPPAFPENFAAIENLPKKIRITSDEATSTKGFAFANDAWRNTNGKVKNYLAAEGKTGWRYSNQIDEIWEEVDQLADGNFNLVKPQTLEKINSLQKYSQNIRNSYELFQKDHAAPKAWDEFHESYDQLNQAIARGDKREIMEKAEALSASFGKLPDSQMIRNLKPAKAENFKAYLKKTLSEMQPLLSKKKLTADEFYTLQKQTRTLNRYFRAQLAMDPAPEAQKIAEFLRSASEQLGQSRISIAPKLRQDLKEFLKRIELDPPKRRTWQRPRGAGPVR